MPRANNIKKHAFPSLPFSSLPGKNATEVEGFRRAHRRDAAAYVRFLYWLYNKTTVDTAGRLVGGQACGPPRHHSLHRAGGGAAGGVQRGMEARGTTAPLARARVFPVPLGQSRRAAVFRSHDEKSVPETLARMVDRLIAVPGEGRDGAAGDSVGQA